MEERLNSSSPIRKANGSIDSLQVVDIEEAIVKLKTIGVRAKQSTEYDDEIDIVQIDNKTKFMEWLSSERFNLSTYPRLRTFLK